MNSAVVHSVSKEVINLQCLQSVSLISVKQYLHILTMGLISNRTKIRKAGELKDSFRKCYSCNRRKNNDEFLGEATSLYSLKIHLDKFDHLLDDAVLG